MLTEDQHSEFEKFGIVKIPALLSRQAISLGQKAILSRFERLNLAANGKWHLDGRPPAKWPDKGYSAKSIGNKIDDVERLLDEPGIKPVAHGLLNSSDLDHQYFKRPQILVTLPNAGDWFIPSNGWHVDIARAASGRRPGVQVFILLSDIKPQGGGTLVVRGSHKLLNDGRFIRSRDVVKILRQDPHFHDAISAKRPKPVEAHGAAGKMPSAQNPELDLVELTGAPGDAYFVDMRAIHSAAPNMSAQPRVMATHRFLRADVVPELTT